jgi:hypothetical protein
MKTDKRLTLIFILLALVSLSVHAQSNIVKNGFFENGDESRWQCSYQNYVDVHNLITDWEPAFTDNTYDWEIKSKNSDPANCYNGLYWSHKYPDSTPSEKIIWRFAGEAMLGNLTTPLSSSKSYIIRAKIRPNSQSMRTYVRIGFCSGTNGKYSRPKVYDYYQPTWFTIPENSSLKWHTFEQVIQPTSNFDGKLTHIIIDRSGDDCGQHDPAFFIDEIELYEYCPDQKLIQNRTYLYKEDNEAYGIFCYDVSGNHVVVGENVDGSLEIKNFVFGMAVIRVEH